MEKSFKTHRKGEGRRQKKVLLCTMLAAAALGFSGCSYDDDDLWATVNQQAERIAALENWQKQVTGNMTALQAVLDASDRLTEVTPIREGGEVVGYTLVFSKAGEVKLYIGSRDTLAGIPVISVKEMNGKWYWTLNGQLMTDRDGQPLCANGVDGEDGVLPIVKTGKELGEGYRAEAVYLSVDGGKVWTCLQTPAGESEGASSIITRVDMEQEGQAVFYLADGTAIVLPVVEDAAFRLKYGTTAAARGVLRVERAKTAAGLYEDFQLAYEVAEGFSLRMKVESCPDSWTVSAPADGKINVSFAATTVRSAEDTASLLFTLVGTDNETQQYRVRLTVVEKVSVPDVPVTPTEISSVTNVGGIQLQFDSDGHLTPSSQQDLQTLAKSEAGLTLPANTTPEDAIKLANYASAVSGAKLDFSQVGYIPDFELEHPENIVSLNVSGCFISQNQRSSRVARAARATASKVFNPDNQHADFTIFEGLVELKCDGNKVVSIGVPEKVQALSLKENQLTTLNLVSNTNLKELDVSYNKLKENLNLSANTQLEKLDCSNNQIAQLNVSPSALKEVNVSGNSLNQQLDLSNSTQLEKLDCSNSGVTSVAVPATNTLKELDVSGNGLNQTLDLSANKGLQTVNCSGNQITSMTLPATDQLTEVNCSGNNIENLDVTQCPSLQTLECNGNQMTELDVSNNPNLTTLSCGEQKTGDGADAQTKELTLTITEDQAAAIWDNKQESAGENTEVKVNKVTQATGGATAPGYGDGGDF